MFQNVPVPSALFAKGAHVNDQKTSQGVSPSDLRSQLGAYVRGLEASLPDITVVITDGVRGEGAPLPNIADPDWWTQLDNHLAAGFRIMGQAVSHCVPFNPSHYREPVDSGHKRRARDRFMASMMQRANARSDMKPSVPLAALMRRI